MTDAGSSVAAVTTKSRCSIKSLVLKWQVFELIQTSSEPSKPGLVIFLIVPKRTGRMPKRSTTNISGLSTQEPFLEPSFYSGDVLAMLDLGNLKISQPMGQNFLLEAAVVSLDASSPALTTKQS